MTKYSVPGRELIGKLWKTVFVIKDTLGAFSRYGAKNHEAAKSRPIVAAPFGSPP